MNRRFDSSSNGNVAVQLLATLLILGVLAATSVITFGNSSTKASGRASTTSCSSVAACSISAYQQACKADATSLEVAAQVFDASNKAPIALEVVGRQRGQIRFGFPSTYSQGAQAQKLLGSYIRAWPGDLSGGAYALSLSSTVAGDVAIHIPANAPGAGVDFEQESSTSGCNSL